MSATSELVVAVIVAYNRRALLAQALDALAAQSRRADRVIVVDNASTDGSGELAEAHPLAPTVLKLSRNTGGAGGFAVGIAAALDLDADAIWVMDDDTIPTADALAELLAARDRVPERPAVVGSRVVWIDGKDHPMNRPRRRVGVAAAPFESELGLTPVRSSSFVSMLVDGQSARAAGLPIADYFIWNDDFEYSTRLLRDAPGYYCERSVVEHRTVRRGATDDDPGPRFYYEVRNKVWLFRWSKGLRPGERLLYLGSSVRRWVRTYIRSSDRGVLRREGWRGLRDGLSAPPRSDLESLADLGEVGALIARFDRS